MRSTLRTPSTGARTCSASSTRMRDASVTASAVTLLTIGTRASPGLALERLRQAFGDGGHEWRVNAPDTASQTTRFAPATRIGSSVASSTSTRPEMTTWPEERRWRPPDRSGGHGGDDALDLGTRQADDGRHPAGTTRIGHEVRAALREARAAPNSRTPAATRAAYSPTEWPATTVDCSSVISPSTDRPPRTSSAARLRLPRVVDRSTGPSQQASLTDQPSTASASA